MCPGKRRSSKSLEFNLTLSEEWIQLSLQTQSSVPEERRFSMAQGTSHF
jgi:hypothetical protein